MPTSKKPAILPMLAYMTVSHQVAVVIRSKLRQSYLMVLDAESRIELPGSM